MTERERLILKGKDVAPATADEAAIKTAIDNAGSGGGTELPEPGTAGNVLTSTGEAWVSAAPADNIYAVNVTKLSDSWLVYHGGTEIGVSDIVAAVQAGKTVDLTFVNGSGAKPIKCELAVDESAANSLVFTSTYNDPDKYFTNTRGQYNVTVLAMIQGNVDRWMYYEQFIPNPRGVDIGKVLTVVSDGDDGGKYVLETNKDPLILTGTEGANSAFEITGATLAEIYAAATAGKYVAVDIPISDFGVTVRVPLIGYNYDSADDKYAFSFDTSLSAGASSCAIISLECNNALTGTIKLQMWSTGQ